MDVREHLVLVVRPLREAREEFVHALAVGVVDVRAVLMDENAVLVQIIEGVARDMVAALENRDTETRTFRHAARAHRTGISSADDNHVVFIGVERCGETTRDLHTCSLQAFPH